MVRRIPGCRNRWSGGYQGVGICGQEDIGGVGIGGQEDTDV